MLAMKCRLEEAVLEALLCDLLEINIKVANVGLLKFRLGRHCIGAMKLRW